MKTRVLVLSTIVSLGMIFQGCEKDDSISNKSLSNTKNKSSTNINKSTEAPPTDESICYADKISFENMDPTCLDTIFINYPNAFAEITYLSDEEIYKITFTEEGDYEEPDGSGDIKVYKCRGAASNVWNCLQRAWQHCIGFENCTGIGMDEMGNNTEVYQGYLICP